jgi:hypothetical protein
MRPKSLSAVMILVPAGSAEARDVGEPDCESWGGGLELGAGDDTDEALPEDAESSGVESDDKTPQPSTAREEQTEHDNEIAADRRLGSEVSSTVSESSSDSTTRA